MCATTTNPTIAGNSAEKEKTMKMILEFGDVSRDLGERLVLLAKEINELEQFDSQNEVIAVAISKEIASKRFSFQENN